MACVEPLPGASEEFRQHWPLMLGILSAIVAGMCLLVAADHAIRKLMEGEDGRTPVEAAGAWLWVGIVATVVTLGCVYAGLWRMAKRRRELTT